MPRSLSQRLVLYGIGAGAVTAATALGGKSKPSQIMYSGPVEFSGNTIHFDLQNVVPPSSSFMSSDDFKMKSDCSNSKAKIKGEGTYNTAIGANIRYSRPYAFKLPAGATIGMQTFYGTAYFNDLYNGSGDFGNNAGDWQPGDRGFLALRIQIDCSYYFGWADVSLNTLSCNGQPVFTLHSYAFNKEGNESISAGEIKLKKRHQKLARPSCTPTPTPSTPLRNADGDDGSNPVAAAAIGLLIAGASGVTALKRRK